jgi:hypothetical protein
MTGDVDVGLPSVENVFIRLFERGADRLKVVKEMLQQRLCASGDKLPLLLIVCRRVPETRFMPGVVAGHVYGTRGRRATDWSAALAATAGYILLTDRELSYLADVSGFRLLCIDDACIEAVAVRSAVSLTFYLTRSEFRRVGDLMMPARVRNAFLFEQWCTFSASYRRGDYSFLDGSTTIGVELPFPDGRDMTMEVCDAVRRSAELPPCAHCGAVIPRGMPVGFCCRPFDAVMREHLPHAMDPDILARIAAVVGRNVNFPRILNRDLRPVIQNSKINGPRGPGGTLFISGIPYALDTFRQFVTPVYAVFQDGEGGVERRGSESEFLIAAVLRQNPVLGEYLRGRVELRSSIGVVSVCDGDPGMNLAILNGDVPGTCAHEIEVVDRAYKAKKIPQQTMLYNQLVYPLIFWDGHGGCGSRDADDWKRVTTLIRKTAIALVLQPREHFIHAMAMLREEFICAVSGRLSNLRIKFLAQAEKRYFVREDEVRAGDVGEKEYGMRAFIPASLTDSAEYWGEVATKCFAISTQFGAPTFFLTFTMNPYWCEFEALKRGPGTYSDSAMAAIVFKMKLSALMNFIQTEEVLGTVRAFVWRVEYQRRGLPHAHILFWTNCDTMDMAVIDRIVNVRFAKRSPFYEHQEMVTDFRTLIRKYQLHSHSKRCKGPNGSCKYGYPQKPAVATSLQGHDYVFQRNENEVDVVPHSPAILSKFRSHHCLEVIHSDQCIGYVLKYCAKNTDQGEVMVRNVLYEGRPVNRSQPLEYFAATRISSACECFAGICGYWRHHLKPTVVALNLHLEGQKVVLVFGQHDEREKVDAPSRLERYFGRPLGAKFEDLTYTQYYSSYTVCGRRTAVSATADLYRPTHFAAIRRKPVLAIINSVNIRATEIFALRMLLARYPARSWGDLRTRDGRMFPDFQSTVRYLGLIADVNDEVRLAMLDAIHMGRPPSDLRFLFVQMAAYVSNAEALQCEFWGYFFDRGDTDESVREKFRRLSSGQRFYQACSIEDMVELRFLSSEQRVVATSILDSIRHGPKQLFFQARLSARSADRRASIIVFNGGFF